MPVPNARGRAVSQDAARVRGVPAASAPAPTTNVSSHVADMVAHDPALAQLLSRKVKRTGLNVHINTMVHNAFSAFIDEFGLPKGDAASLALQEFLERRGVLIPGVARVLPQPAQPVADTAATEGTGDQPQTGV